MGPHTLCVLMHWGIPLFHHDGQGYDHYVLQNAAGRGTIIMFYIMLPAGVRLLFYIMLSWRLLVLTGVWRKELPKYARPTRKVAKRCANLLVSPYSYV